MRERVMVPIMVLLSCNWQPGLVGLRSINEGRNFDLTTAIHEVLAYVGFRQPMSQAEKSTELVNADKCGLVLKRGSQAP